ncbi:MAG: hypothetical protein JO066_09390 [Verrucomicrobia bacterium]|nr:hypothetical protein [Verrucomicrobiota bacterium]
MKRIKRWARFQEPSVIGHSCIDFTLQGRESGGDEVGGLIPRRPGIDLLQHGHDRIPPREEFWQ